MSEKQYQKLHRWIRKNLGTATYCSNNRLHKAKRFDWANISDKYEYKINSYKPLCRSCHIKMDFTEQRRIKIIKNLNHTGLPIIKMDKEKNIINKYKSITEASEKTGVLRTSIMNCLKDRTKTAGGYIWLYQ